jgi:hypothetical protein
MYCCENPKICSRIHITLWSSEGKVKASPCSRPHGPRGGSRGIAPLFNDLGTRWGWVVNITNPAAFTPGKDSVPTVQEAGWASGQVWTDAENLAPTGIRSPDRPSSSELLYRLSYPGVLFRNTFKIRHFQETQHRHIQSRIVFWQCKDERCGCLPKYW